MRPTKLFWLPVCIAALLLTGCTQGASLGIQEGPRPLSQRVLKVDSVSLQMSPEYPF